MDPAPDRKFSFPNADQPIPGVSDTSRPQPEQRPTPQRPTVNILDALSTQKKREGDLQKIHTFQEDIASAIKNDNLSMIKMALAEKRRQEKQGAPVEFEENNSKKYVMIGGTVVVAILFLAGAYLFISNSFKDNRAPAGQTTATEPLLYTEKLVTINIDQKDSDDVARLIKRELDSPPELGSMKGISLIAGTGTSTREITVAEFFVSMQARVPDSLVRSLDSRFLLGLYSFSPNDFFILTKVNSYDSAFAGMLQWEPDMESDIGSFMVTRKPIVPIAVLTQPKATSTASTTSASAGLFSQRAWVDRVVNNKDARVLIDSDGNPAMLYTFLDKENLVIVSSDKSLKEIMFRLTAGRIVR